jgi:hypothetical protein
MNVLVAYASRFGSTSDIAECIAEKLRQQGTPADARPVEAAVDLDGYDAFVVGSAVFAGHWMEEATEFVRRHRAVLVAKAVAARGRLARPARDRGVGDRHRQGAAGAAGATLRRRTPSRLPARFQPTPRSGR